MIEFPKDALAFFPLEGQQRKRMENLVERGGSWDIELGPGDTGVVCMLQTRMLYLVADGKAVFQSPYGKFNIHISAGTVAHVPAGFQHRWSGETDEGGFLLGVAEEMSIRAILAPSDGSPHK